MPQVHANTSNTMTRIVIIGGGTAGITTAQVLAKKLKSSDNTEVVLIEKNAYFYHAVGAPRAFVDASYTKKMFVPAALLRLCTLNTSCSPWAARTPRQSSKTASTTLDQPPRLNYKRSHIENAENIVVVGGGAVGCELAAEIKFKYPRKSVTIIEAHNKLIAGSNLNDKFYKRLTASLDKLGVTVMLGERLAERLNGNGLEKRTLRTDKGTEVESDIQLLCGGFSPAAALVRDFDPSLVTNRGAVKVNENLQLEGEKCRHIFALGDVSNHPAPKLAFIAGEQGRFLATELVAVIQKKQMGFNKPFKAPGTAAMLLPLGPSGGVSQLPLLGGIVVGNRLTRMIKARDFFAGMVWSSLGATAPK
ncbi:unnamed protein product [Phytophthora lilii]|uniref:Unnamed protein product n=1 Tax=Phytophthora lilii TaxID=2077276 RepID=A0A9W6XI25_9STRA|nr:unnamed protein product [Phytophthora lilii]